MNKEEKILLRITTEDKELIKQYCEKYGLSVSNFMRYCTLQKVREDLENEKEE
ncbi:MAG: DUF6290 family protein [Bacilli bacterium]